MSIYIYKSEADYVAVKTGLRGTTKIGFGECKRTAIGSMKPTPISSVNSDAEEETINWAMDELVEMIGCERPTLVEVLN